MKTTNLIPMAMLAVLLAGCNQQKPDPRIDQISQQLANLEKNAVQPRWEYKVEVDDVSDVANAVAKAKNDLADAQYDLALAKANQQSAFGKLSATGLHDAKIDAIVDRQIKIDNNEDEREEGLRTNVLAIVSGRTDWELVAFNILPERSDRVILIFKRPVK